jgi:PleD family two-component response regulator
VVIESDGGIDITDILDKQSVQLIVLNLDTRKIAGFKILCILKKSLKYKSIPLIAYSSTESAEVAEKAKRACANTYLSITSITTSDFVKKVKEILQIK